MNPAPFSASQLRESVIAVPPLARTADFKICPIENAKLIRYLEAGGVRSLLYGGNAVLYHVQLSEFDALLKMLADETSRETVVVPSFGPAYGFAMDQVEVLRDYDFPTAMLLPIRDIADQAGIASGIRRIAEKYGKPIVVYLKFDRWLDCEHIRKLDQDGVISWIKYAVVREDTLRDDYLREVMDAFPAERIVSGIGEQPAIVHLRDFGITGFTSGCICVAPGKSMQMLRAIQADSFEEADSIRRWFEPLENLRNEIHPIRVLHHAVAAVGICNTGPILPMLSDLNDGQIEKIRVATQNMLS